MWQKRPMVMGLMVLALLLAFLGFTADSAPVYAQTAWQATYWNNQTLSGTPVLQRQEGAINYNWGDGSPDPQVSAENFSARWTGTIDVPAGTYRFTATMDDGMRVWVDDVLIIDSWYDSQVHSISRDVNLSGGTHQVRVEYYEAGGGAIAMLDWGPVPGVIQNWRGEYFNNMTLSGNPTVIRDDAQINFEWLGAPSAGIGGDHFSVRWTRSPQFEAGRYRFTVTVDDGARLWVNNQLIIDQWHDQTITAHTAEIDLPGGATPIRLEYYENTGGAIIRLDWTRISAPGTPGTPTATWQAEYFNNVDLSGSPVLVRQDNQLDFNWGSSSPAPNVVGADRFSVRWSRTVNLGAGRYRFTAVADDGIRVWVNNQQIIDEWRVQTVQTYAAELNLPGGNVPIVVEYFENTGLAEVRLTWTQTSGTPPTGGELTATVINARHLNVRSGPGMDFDAFTYISRGQSVPVLGRDRFTNWIQIRLPDGRVGWSSARYLTSSTPFTSLPVVNP